MFMGRWPVFANNTFTNTFTSDDELAQSSRTQFNGETVLITCTLFAFLLKDKDPTPRFARQNIK